MRSVTGAAERFGQALEAHGTRRVGSEDVWRAFLEADPAFVTDVDKRARLASALDELASGGRVLLPSARSFDHGSPPLPNFVTVGGPRSRPTAATGARTFPWRPELSWAAGARLASGQLDALRAVNSWLRDNGDAGPDVAARERSLQIFGDEKALDRLSRTALFGPGRLSLTLLRCHAVHPPFVWRRVGPAPVLLVVENHHSFDTFVRLLPADGPVGAVAYGAGNHFIASVAFVADLEPPVQRVSYFGDIDSQGLRIPVAATAVAASLGLPPVTPASGLYQLLFEVGRPARCDSPPLPRPAAEARAGWLPESLRGPAADLLVQGLRLAQEWVGAEALLRRGDDGDWAQVLRAS